MIEEDSVEMKKGDSEKKVKEVIQENFERKRKGWIAGKRQRKSEW